MSSGQKAKLKLTGQKKVQLKRRKDAFKNANSKRGAPTLFNKTVARRICQCIMEGYSLHEIQQMDRMPSLTTFYEWMNKYPEFHEAYSIAKQLQMDTLADKLMTMADDYLDVQKARLKSEVYFKLMARLAPKKYGDKLALSHETDKPVEIRVTYDDKLRHSTDDGEAK